MASAKLRRRKQLQPKSWSPKESKVLLANLNFVVATIYVPRGQNRPEEVLEELQRRLQHTFRRPTKGQIETQLRKEFKRYNVANSWMTFEEFLRKGCSALARLDDDRKSDIQEQLDLIKSEELCAQLSSPRKTRRASRTPGIESSQLNLSQTISIDKTTNESNLTELCQSPQGWTPKRAVNSRLSLKVRKYLSKSKIQTKLFF
jgi:hypothetical protein